MDINPGTGHRWIHRHNQLPTMQKTGDTKGSHSRQETWKMLAKCHGLREQWILPLLSGNIRPTGMDITSHTEGWGRLLATHPGGDLVPPRSPSLTHAEQLSGIVWPGWGRALKCQPLEAQAALHSFPHGHWQLRTHSATFFSTALLEEPQAKPKGEKEKNIHKWCSISKSSHGGPTSKAERKP